MSQKLTKLKQTSLAFLLALGLSANLAKYIVEKGQSPREQIMLDRMQYSDNCGWIDWSHAMPEGPVGLLKDVLSGGNENPDDCFPVSYSQSMGKRLGPITITAGTSITYCVDNGLNKEQRIEAAASIFRHVSEEFERLERSFPYALSPEAQGSSFQEGDLTSNLISFYRALYGYSREDIAEGCGAVGAQASLQRLEERPLNPQLGLEPFLDFGSEFPEELTGVNFYAGDQYVTEIAREGSGFSALSIAIE